MEMGLDWKRMGEVVAIDDSLHSYQASKQRFLWIYISRYWLPQTDPTSKRHALLKEIMRRSHLEKIHEYLNKIIIGSRWN